MNVDILESVRQEIVYYPQRFCAAQWAFARNAERVIESGDVPDGFRCCIAGHVLLKSGLYDERNLLREGGFHDTGYLWEQAGDVLGLTTAQRNELFFPSQWDKPYKQNYYLCSRAEEAEVAASYIDYYVSKYAVPSTEADATAPADPVATDETLTPAHAEVVAV